MLEGVCHCGAVHWRFKGAVEDAANWSCVRTKPGDKRQG